MKWEGNGLRLLTQATEALGNPAKGRRAYSMALNKVATTVNSSVKKSVAQQMGTSQRNIVKHGGMKIYKASAGNLMAVIDVRGGYLPLKDFSPRQGKKGVSAAEWGNRKMHPGTWINRARLATTKFASTGRAKAGGHVFKNTGGENKVSGRKNAIEVLWGPAVPREVVRDESQRTFYRIADTRMPIEVRRAIKALTKGAVS
ncbi:MAG: phage tail protein [Allorhizobium sp.]